MKVPLTNAFIAHLTRAYVIYTQVKSRDLIILQLAKLTPFHRELVPCSGLSSGHFDDKVIINLT